MISWDDPNLQCQRLHSYNHWCPLWSLSVKCYNVAQGSMCTYWVQRDLSEEGDIKLLCKPPHPSPFPLREHRPVLLWGGATVVHTDGLRELAPPTSQHGQVKPLMFSSTPMTSSPILRQKLSSFLMVARATSWGVVTTIAPSGLAFMSAFTIVRCSSDVPGGVCGRGQEQLPGNGDMQLYTYMCTHTQYHKGTLVC